MNRRALHKTGWLGGLLLLSALTVPLGHALQHSEVAAPISAPAVEAWCDLCHQPFVAFAQDSPVLVAASVAVPICTPRQPTPPSVWVPLAQPRGPPAAV